MALDPSISLAAVQNAPQLNVGQAAQQGMTLANLALQPQLTQAQIAATQQSVEASKQAVSASQTAQAGQVIQNQQAQKELDTRTAIAAMTKNMTKVDPVTGVVTPPNPADVAAAVSAQGGVDPGTVFSLVQSGQLAAQQSIKTGADAKAYADSVGTTTQNLLRGLDPTNPADRQQALNILGNSLKQLSSVVGPDQAKMFMSQRFNTDALQPPASPPTLDSNGNPVPAQPAPPMDPNVVAAHAIKQAGVNATSESISPAQAEANRLTMVGQAQTQQQIGLQAEANAQAGASGVVSPAARDPNSPISKMAQQQYLAANPSADPAQVAKLSAADIQHQVGAAGTVSANVVPASAKGAAAASAVTLQQQAQIMDQLQTAAAAAKAAGLPSGTPAATVIGNTLGTRLMSVPAIQNYQTLLNQAKNAGISIDMSQGPDSISSYAANQAKTLRGQAGTTAAITASPTFTGTAAATGPAPPNATLNFPKSPQLGQPLKFKNPNGGPPLVKRYIGGDPSQLSSYK